VDPGATISVTASSDLEVERTIDFVLLGTENRSQIFGHFEERKLYPIKSLFSMTFSESITFFIKPFMFLSAHKNSMFARRKR
jgi:hypothetical protein